MNKYQKQAIESSPLTHLGKQSYKYQNSYNLDIQKDQLTTNNSQHQRLLSRETDRGRLSQANYPLNNNFRELQGSQQKQYNYAHSQKKSAEGTRLDFQNDPFSPPRNRNRYEQLVHTNPKQKFNDNRYLQKNRSDQKNYSPVNYQKIYNQPKRNENTLKLDAEIINNSSDQKIRVLELENQRQFKMEISNLTERLAYLIQLVQHSQSSFIQNNQLQGFQQRLIDQQARQEQQTSQLQNQIKLLRKEFNDQIVNQYPRNSDESVDQFGQQLNSVKQRINELEQRNRKELDNELIKQLQKQIKTTQNLNLIEFQKLILILYIRLRTQMNEKYSMIQNFNQDQQNEIIKLQKNDVESIVAKQISELKNQIQSQQNQKYQEQNKSIENQKQFLISKINSQLQLGLQDLKQQNEQNQLNSQNLNQRVSFLEQMKDQNKDSTLQKIQNMHNQAIQKLQTQLDEQKNNLQKLSQQQSLPQLNEIINVQMQQYHEKRIKDIEHQKNNNGELERQLQGLGEILKTVQQEQTNQKKNQEKTNQNYEIQYKNLISKISEITQKINELNEQVHEMKQKIDQQQTEMDLQKTNLQEQKNKLINQASELKGLAQVNDTFKSELRNLNFAFQKNIQDISEKNAIQYEQIQQQIVQQVQNQLKNLQKEEVNKQHIDNINSFQNDQNKQSEKNEERINRAPVIPKDQEQKQQEEQALKKEIIQEEQNQPHQKDLLPNEQPSEPVIIQQDPIQQLHQLQQPDQIRLKQIQDKINDIYNQTSRKRAVSGEFLKFIRDEQNNNELYRNYSIRQSEQKRQLALVCNAFRQARGDGNCFYTAFGFQFFTILLNKYSQEQYQQFIAKIDKIIKFKINYGDNSIDNQELEQQCWNELKYRLEVLRNIEDPNLRQQEFIQHFAAYEQHSEEIDGCFYGLSTIFFRNIAYYVVNNSDWKDAIYDLQNLLIWEEECNNNEVVIQLLSQFLEVHIKLVFFNDGKFQLREYSEGMPYQIILLITPGHYNVGIYYRNEEQL